MKLLRKLSAKGVIPVGAALFAGVLFTSCATTEDPAFTSSPAAESRPAAPTSGTNQPSGNDGEKVRFQVGDLIRINFSGSIETLLPHEERIKDDGTITLPLIGAIKALGKTPGEVQNEIQTNYVPKYYLRLTVTVSIQPAEMLFYVGGEVRSAGGRPYVGVTTVTKAVQSAGGFTDFADKKRVILTRANGTRIKVNCKEAERNSNKDPQVFPGDKINVPKSWW